MAHVTALRTTTAALAGLIAFAWGAPAAIAQQDRGEELLPSQQITGIETGVPPTGTGTGYERERDGARFAEPGIGFDVPSRAEQAARAQVMWQLARRDVREARAERLRAEREAREQLQRSATLAEARQEVEDARQELAERRRELQQELQQHDLYLETQERADQLAEMIAEAHRRPDVTRAQLMDLANQRLFYNQRLNDLEGELADTTAVDQARQQVRDAVNQLRELEAEIPTMLSDMPEVAEARQREQQARQRLDSSRVELAGAREAYLEADFRQDAFQRIRRQRPLGIGVGTYDPWTWGWGWRGGTTVRVAP